MARLMSREGFEAWLLSQPEPGDVVEHMDFTDYWSECLKDGGGDYAKDIRKLGTEYLKNLANGNKNR